MYTCVWYVFFFGFALYAYYSCAIVCCGGGNSMGVRFCVCVSVYGGGCESGCTHARQIIIICMGICVLGMCVFFLDFLARTHIRKISHHIFVRISQYKA